MIVSQDRDTVALARAIRGHALRMVHAAKASHIGGCLSMADILAVLYGRVMKFDPTNPNDATRDRFVLSKGHGAAILYAVLAEAGFFDVAELATYCVDGSRLTGHASHGVPGVELSTGSLGHGLSVAAGFAIAMKHAGHASRSFALLSDGELDEGSNWEPFLFAPQAKLANLTAIIDYNKIQSFGRVEDIIDLEPLGDKLRSFRWNVREIDGHDHAAIAGALAPSDNDRPVAVIAHTVKGKGVSFMENLLKWHYSSPSDEQLSQALAELNIQ
jgi:transketolase